MSFIHQIFRIALVIMLINLPFGLWRSMVRKLSIPWFFAVHLPIPMAIGLRWFYGVPFQWKTFPLFVFAFFCGQFLGGTLGRFKNK